jgi:hypothetical protein
MLAQSARDEVDGVDAQEMRAGTPNPATRLTHTVHFHDRRLV